MANIRNRLSSPACILTRGLLGLFVLVLFCSFAKADLKEGFIHGYWFDNSYSDVMGTCSGTACRTISISEDGLFGQAILCNGGYVRLEDSHGTGFGIADGRDGKMTIMCWFNPSSAATSERVLISNSAWKSGKNPGVVLDAQYKGGPYYNIGDGTDRIDLNANVPTVANEWQFAAITADLTTNQAYLYYGTANGTLQQAQVDSSKLQNIDSLLSSYKWYIGEDYNDYYFYGLIDEMGIWNRALSFDEINQVYTTQKNGTSLGNQLNFASSVTTAKAGAYMDGSTWEGGVVPKVDANVTINSAVTSDGRTFNGDAVIGEDGSLSATGCVFVGHSNGADATLTINGGDNVFSGNKNNNYSSSLIIGFQGGNGEFVLNDGTVTTSAYTYVGYNQSGEAKFTQNGGTFNSGNNIAVAYHENEVATLTVTGGEMNVNGMIRIGIGADSTGLMTVSGGNVTAKILHMGRASAGDSAKLEITGGVVEVTDAIYGSSSKPSGNIYISGTGQLVLNSSNTGNAIRELTSFKIEGSGADGTGALLFKKSLKGAAAITLTNNATIGIEPGAAFTQTAAIAETQSSSLTVTGGGTLALTAQSSFTGGTIIDSSCVKLTGAGTLGESAITLNNGALEFNNSTATIASAISGTGDILVSGGTATVTGAVTQTSGSTTLANGTTLSLGADSTLNNLSVSDEDSTANLTAAALTLNNDLTSKFIGTISATSIEKTGNGTLQINSGETGKVAAGNLNVTAGRLDFKGNYEGNAELFSGATLSPGNSIGTMNFDGDLVLDSGSTLLMEIGSTEAEGNDQLFVSGSVTYKPGSIVQFALDTTSGFTPSANDIIYIDMPDVDWDNATFSSYYFTFLGYADGQMLLGVDPNAVPEPSTWALLALGAAGLMYLRKRTRK